MSALVTYLNVILSYVLGDGFTVLSPSDLSSAIGNLAQSETFGNFVGRLVADPQATLSVFFYGFVFVGVFFLAVVLPVKAIRRVLKKVTRV